VEFYADGGKCHRDPAQGPAWAGLEDGRHIEAYMVNGSHHRPEADGPAVTYRDPETGRVIRQEYYLDGKTHRVDGPAYVEYRDDGSFLCESWYCHGSWHRDPAQGPASTWINPETGNRYENFFVNGRLHRDPAEGPADTVHDPNGVIIRETYFINGEQIGDSQPEEVEG